MGENGTIIHFNGSTWSTTGKPTEENLYGIWGSSGTDIFAVGDNKTIVRYDTEKGWENVSTSLPTVNLRDVWGSSANDVYAVGEGGFIAHFNSSTWSQVTSPTTKTLKGIWGNASNNYVAVGEDGKVVDYDGFDWSEMASGTTADLQEVWGSASDNIYAVGESGTIIHSDGSDWSGITSPTSANLRGIWGSAADNVYAVGEHGCILYYDGTEWIKLDSGTQDNLMSTFGTLNPRVMIVGYDGNITGITGPSVQGKICNTCSGAAINNVFVELDKNKATYQSTYTNSYGIYPPLQSQSGEHSLYLGVTGYLPQETTVNLPGPSLVDHATYLVPSPGYQGCLSGTITKTVSIGSNPSRENSKGVQNIKVLLYQGDDTLIKGPVYTDAGGNYHFIGVSAGSNYKIKPIITASECTTTPLEYTGITVPTTAQYAFQLQCPAAPPPAEASLGQDNPAR